MKWFRMYSSVLNDPKVQRLSPALFKNWVNILCLANESEPRGTLPSVEDIGFALRLKPSDAQSIVSQLERAGLIDRTRDGRHSPHNWPQRQRASDDIAARVRGHRERKAGNEAVRHDAGNEYVTLHVTTAKRTVDTDTDTDTDITLRAAPSDPADSDTLPTETDALLTQVAPAARVVDGTSRLETPSRNGHKPSGNRKDTALAPSLQVVLPVEDSDDFRAVGGLPPREPHETTDRAYWERVVKGADPKQRTALLVRLAHEKCGVNAESGGEGYARLGALAKRSGAGLVVKWILQAASEHVDGEPLDYISALANKNAKANEGGGSHGRNGHANGHANGNRNSAPGGAREVVTDQEVWRQRAAAHRANSGAGSTG